MYRYPIALTQQFRFCGNAFRADMYKGCDFGCIYCFANSRKGNFKQSVDIADFKIVEKTFLNALESDKGPNNLDYELIRHRVPLHLGGMSDPFQPREWKHRLTYRFLKLTKKYNYPVLISTKCASFPEEYWELFDPKIHAFQISLISPNEPFIRLYESKTPSPKHRMNLIRDLKKRGFWVSLRLQPLIDLKEALELVQAIGNNVDYITVEHLKLSVDDPKTFRYFKTALSHYYRMDQNMRNLELDHLEKLSNIRLIKSASPVPVGVGDNDWHELSDSRCCCGIDTINENFNNWLKYNYTYFVTGEMKDAPWFPNSPCDYVLNIRGKRGGQKRIDDWIKTRSGEEVPWVPKGDCWHIVNSHTRPARLKTIRTVKAFTDYYCEHFQFSLFRKSKGLGLL